MTPHFNCLKCSHSKECFTADLLPQDKLDFNDRVKKKTFVPRGSKIFSEGEPCTDVYKIVEGTVKLTRKNEYLDQECCAIELSGSMLGIDSLGMDGHSCTATASEDTFLCRIPVKELDELSSSNKALRRTTYKLLSDKVKSSKNSVRFYATKIYKGKSHLVVSFVNEMYKQSLQKSKGDSFYMPVRNADIANLLGVSAEKVSRVFKQLKVENVLSKKGRMLVVHDADLLAQIANGCKRL